MYLHSAYIDGRTILDNPFVSNCPYCKSRLVLTEIEDYWPISDDKIQDTHKETIESYKEIHDLEDCYVDLQLETQDSTVEVHYCWSCGWWRLIKKICICAREWQIWDIHFGCAGILKRLEDFDIDEPLTEVRDFLTRFYEQRFNLNPRLFQEVVADVFKSLGYYVQMRNYTNDGGIDILLNDANNQQIGVQVKRYKNSIQLEQIRAFVGALFLNNKTEGIYVTTSSFQPGAKTLSSQSKKAGIPIRLMDATELYEALKIVQIKDRDKSLWPFAMDASTIPSIDYYGWDTPRNSL